MKIALVGNQNCGKTTLFNLLTGMNQKVGNWPGVTVERKSGVIKNTNYELIDLPGVYSLYAYSEEEKITSNFLLKEKVDLVINVVDVTSIERSLYLTTQLMELDIPVILAINMIDLIDKKGIKIDKVQFEKELGVKVVEISSLKNTGIDNLLEIIKVGTKTNNLKIFDRNIENKISSLSDKFNMHKRYYSIKYVEELNELRDKYNFDMDDVIADQRYKFISNIKEKCVIAKNIKESVSEKLDKVFLNKWLCLPFFAFIMFIVYYLSIEVVGNLNDLIVDKFVISIKGAFEKFLTSLGASNWLVSLVIDGVITGVGAVLNFVPQLCILFLCISLLETSGYMSRIAFFLDKIFNKFGLSGKSLVPFIVGSGCSVSGIMTTRTIENKNEREMAITLTPFIPCSAKLPIITLFSQYFFPNKVALISASLYFLSILLILMLAMILKIFVYKGEESPFISELPEYKLPSLKYVLKDVMDKIVSFIERAGTIIFLASIIVWFLLSFSFDLEYGVTIDSSILATIGKSLSWAFYPLIGEFSWEATVSSIQGLIAKEQVVGSMTIISSMSGEIGASIFRNSAFSFFNSVSAYSYVAFNLFSAPCLGAIAAMKQELGNNKKVTLAIVLQVSSAWLVSFLIYVIGSLIVGVK